MRAAHRFCAAKIDRRSSWTRLHPHRVLPGEQRPDQHVLEIVTGLKSERSGLLLGFGHAWVRLIDPDGGVRSVGLYPDESLGISPERRPALRFAGMLLHPDKYDRAALNELTTRLSVDTARFDAIVAHIETLQRDRNHGSLPFSLVESNCVSFVIDIARCARVHVEGEYRLLGTSMPAGIPGLRAVQRVAFNLGLYALGGSTVRRQQWVADEHGQRKLVEVDDLQPIFSSFSDVLTKAVAMHHIRSLRSWQLSQVGK